jgi:hypothetical protein
VPAGPQPRRSCRTPRRSSSGSSPSPSSTGSSRPRSCPKMEAMYAERAAAIEGGMQQAEEAQAEARLRWRSTTPSSPTRAPRPTRSARTLVSRVRRSSRRCVPRPRPRPPASSESAKRQIEAERQQAVVQLRQEVGTPVDRPWPARSSASRLRRRGAPEGHRRPLPRRARGRRRSRREGRLPGGSGRLMRGSSRGGRRGAGGASTPPWRRGRPGPLGRGPLRDDAVVDGNASLRRALADPSREPAAKQGLARAVFGRQGRRGHHRAGRPRRRAALVRRA